MDPQQRIPFNFVRARVGRTGAATRLRQAGPLERILWGIVGLFIVAAAIIIVIPILLLAALALTVAWLFFKVRAAISGDRGKRSSEDAMRRNVRVIRR